MPASRTDEAAITLRPIVKHFHAGPVSAERDAEGANVRQVDAVMLAGGVKSLDDWESFPVIKKSDVPKFSPDEPFWWQLPDGRMRELFRDNGGSSRLYQSFSSDSGRTWSRPTITTFPNATSKCYPLKLSSGAWDMISNANPKWARREMYLSLSEDGLTFTKMARLVIPSAKATTFQYPHAIERDGHLLIAFSQKKNQTEVLKVPLAAIESLRD